MKMKIFICGILLLILLCGSGASASITYNSEVDLNDGFYRVTVRDSPTYTYFVDWNDANKSLTINVSDTVTWINSDIKDLKITIVSEQELWSEKDSYLKWNTRWFSYRFEKPGKYGVHVSENVKFHQTIIVNPIYDSLGNVKTQEPMNSPVQEISDLDPLLPRPAHTVERYSHRQGTHLAIFMGILFVVFLIIGILKITLLKIIGILRNVPRKNSKR